MGWHKCARSLLQWCIKQERERERERERGRERAREGGREGGREIQPDALHMTAKLLRLRSDMHRIRDCWLCLNVIWYGREDTALLAQMSGEGCCASRQDPSELLAWECMSHLTLHTERQRLNTLAATHERGDN